MKKEKKQILYIFTFLILGCVIGYFVAVTQMKQVNDPEYMHFGQVKTCRFRNRSDFRGASFRLECFFPGYLRD